MTKSQIRAGIVGSGFSVNFHADAIHQAYGTDPEIVDVISSSKETAQTFAEPRGLRTFDKIEALLEGVDVVHVCVPA